MAYQGMTVSRIVDYIVTVCNKKGYDVNRAAIVELLNMASDEMEAASELHLAYWEMATEENVSEYELPDDVRYVHDVLIIDTNDGVGGLPLERTSLKKIKATLANDAESEVVEP